MDPQIALLLWVVVGTVLGAVFGRFALSARPRDWGMEAGVGALGACTFGLPAFAILRFLDVGAAGGISIVFATLGGLIASGAIAFMARTRHI